MNGRNRTQSIRLGVFWLCVGLVFAPLAALTDGAVKEQPAISMKPTSTPFEIVATATVKPWLQPTPAPVPVRQATATPTQTPSPTPSPTKAPTSTPSPTPTPTPSPSPTPTPTMAPTASSTASPTPALEEPVVEAMALTEGQITSLLETAGLKEGETPEEYLELPEEMEKEEDTVTILLIGVDNHDMEKPGRSDSMILAHLDQKTGTIKLVSFLRDMYVKIPGHGMNRLNAAYYYGGIELLEQTLTTNFGIRIDGALAVNFSVVTNLIDELGGVTLTVTEKERVQVNNLLRDFSGSDAHRLAEAGEQRLTGVQALCYSRVRKIDSDFQRVSRQHRVLEALLSRVREMEVGAVFKLMVNNIGAVKTDITLERFTALVPLVAGFENVAVEAMYVPLDNAFYDDVVKGMMVLVPNLTKNSQAIADFLAD